MHSSLLSGPAGQARSLRHPRWVIHHSSLQLPRSPAAKACMHARNRSHPTWHRQTNSRTHCAICSQGRAGQLLVCSTASALLQAAGTPTPPGRACERSCKWVHQPCEGNSSDTPAAPHHGVLSAAAPPACHGQLGSSLLPHSSIYTCTAVCCPADSLYDVLGVSEAANERDIKRAYRQKALKLHPDVNKAVRHKAQGPLQQLHVYLRCLPLPLLAASQAALSAPTNPPPAQQRLPCVCPV